MYETSSNALLPRRACPIITNWRRRLRRVACGLVAEPFQRRVRVAYCALRVLHQILVRPLQYEERARERNKNQNVENSVRNDHRERKRPFM